MTYDKNNIFAKIIRGEIPCKQVYNDEAVMAFEDVAPAAPVHVLVVPKGEYTSFADFSANASAEVSANFFKTIGKIATQLGLDKSGYRIITNNGADAAQTVHHFHVHILGGKAMGGLLRE
jgi:diadenosine tetraphosphate (Ap4A) HIT family hydrolase